MKKLLYILIFITLFSCTQLPTKHDYGINPVVKIKLNDTNNAYRGRIYNEDGQNINEVSIEEYLYSVVGSEMPRSFDIEALKAQAVAARTYALAHKNNLYSDVRSQAYNGLRSESSKIIRAVDETYGQILTYDDKLIDALYTSSCGSKTLASNEYFYKDIPYLKSVQDFTQDKKWAKQYTLDEFNEKLSINTSSIEKIDNFIYFDEEILTARQLKEKLRLRSPRFEIQLIDNVVYINGEGYGHCVGMSQFGANYLAKQGYTYDKILKHYYTGVEIKRIY